MGLLQDKACAIDEFEKRENVYLRLADCPTSLRPCPGKSSPTVRSILLPVGCFRRFYVLLS